MVLSKNKITKPTRLRLKIRSFIVVLPFYEKNNRKKISFFPSSDLLEWQSSSGQVEFENGQFSVLQNIYILDSTSYAPS